MHFTQLQNSHSQERRRNWLRPDSTPEMVSAAGGVPAARGAWANSNSNKDTLFRAAAIGTAVCPLNRSSDRKISTTSTETQAAGITVALGRGRRGLLEARNYGQLLATTRSSSASAGHRPQKWVKGHICFWYSRMALLGLSTLRARARIPAAPRVAHASVPLATMLDFAGALQNAGPRTIRNS